MGRRKQQNPVRRIDDEDTLLISQPSTSSQNFPLPSTSQTQPKNSPAKKFSDFSITTTLKKPSKPSDDLVSAQKAYQVFASKLKMVEN